MNRTKAMPRIGWGRLFPALLAVVAGLAAAVPAGAQSLSEAVESSYPTNLTMLSGAADAAVSELFLNFSAPEGASILVESESDHEAQWFLQSLLLNRLTGSGYTVYLREREPLASANPGRPRSGPVPPREQEPTADAAADPDSNVLTEEEGTLSISELQARAKAEENRGETEAVETPPETVAGTASQPETLPETDYIFRFRVAECGLTYPNSYKKSPLGSRTVQRLAAVTVFATLVRGSREDVAWVGRGDAERIDLVPASKLSLLEGNSFPFSNPVLNTRGFGAYVEPALVTGIVAGLIYLFYTNQN